VVEPCDPRKHGDERTLVFVEDSEGVRFPDVVGSVTAAELEEGGPPGRLAACDQRLDLRRSGF